MAQGKITIKEIAELANTSKTTVSFYLNGKFQKMSDETKDRIEEVIKKTNYRPSLTARSLNRKQMKLIGVVIGDITNAFSNQIVKGIENIALAENYQIVFGNSNYDPETETQYINQMLTMGVDGFIVQPTPQFRSIRKKLDDLGVPVVFFDSGVYEKESKWVKTRNYSATYQAAAACIQKGYERFIMITADPARLSTRLERTMGFTDALKKYGKEPITEVIDTGTQPDTIQEFISQYVQLSSRTLIFVPNCWALPTVHVALKKYRNLMPENIGLIGFDNTEWAGLVTPSVTTIVQPAYQEGLQAVKILLDILKGNGTQLQNQELDCVINWSESTDIKKSSD